MNEWVKFLGVITEEHLTWTFHNNLVKNKAAKMIGIIKRLKFTLPLSALRMLYNAFVLPCLNYGIILWGGGYKTPLQPIHLLQKKAVRLIAGVHYLATTPNLFYDLNILTVFDLYKFQLAIFMYNHQSRKVPPIFDD